MNNALQTLGPVERLFTEQLKLGFTDSLHRYEKYKTCLRRLKAPTQKDLITLAETVRRDPCNENAIIDCIRYCCKGIFFRPSRAKVLRVITEELELYMKLLREEVMLSEYQDLRMTKKYYLHREKDAPESVLKKSFLSQKHKYEVFETIDPFKGKHFVIYRQGVAIRTNTWFATLDEAMAAAEREGNKGS